MPDGTNRKLSPLFVFAPTARCGITLLQRLLNSTRQMIIYGENALLVNGLPGHLLAISAAASQLDGAREKLLSETYDFWSSSVFPDTKQWRAGVCEGIERLLWVYDRSASADGFDRWGIKNPLDDARCCAVLHELLPHAKFVFIYRHVVDVMRSYKARKWLTSEEKLAKVATTWSKNVAYVVQGRADRLLKIRHEDMIASPDDAVDQLERFVGVTGIDRSIFDRKVNTFRGANEHGHAADEYIPPEPLSDRELSIIDKIACEVLGLVGYAPVGEFVGREQGALVG